MPGKNRRHLLSPALVRYDMLRSKAKADAEILLEFGKAMDDLSERGANDERCAQVKSAVIVPHVP